MKWKTNLTAALVLGGVVVAGSGLAWWKIREIRIASRQPPHPEMPQAVSVSNARQVSWSPTAKLSGTVIALQSVVLRNEVAGTIREVRFDSGSLVEAGEVLVTLDTTTEQADQAVAQAAHRVAEAGIRTAEADLSWARSNYDRMIQASEARVAAVADLDRSRSELMGAQARLERAMAQLEQAQANILQVSTLIDKKTIRAPFKAWVGLRSVHPGQYLPEGANIVALQSDSPRIFLDFAVPQEQAFRVVPGLTVMAKAPVLGESPVAITVVALDAVADATTRTIRVRSVVDNPGRVLRPGMSVEIAAPVGDAVEVLTIPTTAVRRASYGDHVFLVVPGEQADSLVARQRFVRLGASLGNDVVVLEGITPGDLVATAGSFKLRDGALVMPAEDVPFASGTPAAADPAPASAKAPPSAADRGS
ncbi:MAG: efflux RND transporter periplasmic adaptor subunit [Phycisphaeraceae bacterium]|nr:efflux RND transporter periplasmic adaptor subunit [Phycisphaerae bacterium]MBX3391784.1 efflux RND transporter periplasmic adaptor subunit [Phycisphaeraceae bacterium]